MTGSRAHPFRCAATAAVIAIASFTAAASTAGAQGARSDDNGRHDHHHDQIAWGACDDPTLQAFGAECAMVSVPLDPDKPRGQQIQLAVSIVRHTVPDDQYQGVMLVNPGGPGGSGLIYSILGAFVPNDAGAAYDWIGFDPRGVGSSVPALSCDPQYFAPTRPDYEIPTRAVERQWLSRSEGYADACDAAGGRLLRHMKTTDSVADMEALRRALGEAQINYYGYSYGTYLGQVYATLHPDRVRRMVLDANVDPTRVWYQANLDQDFAFDRNINLWFEWLAQYDDVYHLGTTAAAVSQLWYTQREAFKAAPAGQIGPDEWTDIFLTVGYAQGSWPYFGDVFANWIATGDPAPLLDEYLAAEGVGDDNNFAVYLAVQCTDVQWPKKFSTWKRDNLAVAAQAPFFTWSNAWFNAPCLYWPAKAGEPVNVRGRKAPPVLLLSETLDAATPFSGTLKVRSLFPKASLVSTPGGTTHASSLFGTVCVAEYVADYLATGALPARQPGNVADAECAPDPEPLPFELQTTVATATSRVAGTDVAAELRQRLSRRFPG